MIEKLKLKLGIKTRGGLVKHALARLAIEEGIPMGPEGQTKK